MQSFFCKICCQIEARREQLKPMLNLNEKKMKKIFTLFVAVLLTASAFLPRQVNAQTPEKISYQAVIRDDEGNLVTEQEIGMQISILQGSASGTAVYIETQTPTTNANGLVSIEIGSTNAIVVSGDFSAIDWANGPYFIKTGTDPVGGINYTITGTSQLLSVPYALHSKSADSLISQIDYDDIANTPNIVDSISVHGFDGDYNSLANTPNIGDMDGENIINLAEPVNEQDATTKAYVDSVFNLNLMDIAVIDFNYIIEPNYGYPAYVEVVDISTGVPVDAIVTWEDNFPYHVSDGYVTTSNGSYFITLKYEIDGILYTKNKIIVIDTL